MYSRKVSRSLSRFLPAILSAGLTGVASIASAVTWDSSGILPTKPTDGSGSWDLTHANWSNGTGDIAWPNTSSGIAVFGNANGVAGNINLTAPVSLAGITFNPSSSGNYNISGTGTLTSSNSSSPIVFNGSSAATVGATITGGGGLTFAGTNTITLNGTSTFFGATNINSGTVMLNSLAAIANGPVNINAGGELIANWPIQFVSGSIMMVNRGTYVFPPGVSYQLSNFQQLGGTLDITGSMITEDGTFYSDGGSIIGTVKLNGGTLSFGPAAGAGNYAFVSDLQSNNGGSISGNISAGSVITSAIAFSSTYTLSIGSTANYGTINLIDPTGYVGKLNIGPSVLTNHGTLNLTTASSRNTFESAFIYGPLVNSTDGTVNINVNVSDTGSINNQGTFNIASGASFNTSGSTFNQTGGVLSIAGVLHTLGGNFCCTGGTITGTVSLGNSGTIYLGSFSPASLPTFNYSGASITGSVSGATASQNIPSGTVVNAQGTSGATALTINTPGNFGAISVIAANGSTGSLNLPSTGFTNHGTITVGATGTPSGSSLLNGLTLNANDGILNITTPTQLRSSNYAPTVNMGIVSVANGASFNAGGFNNFNQAGGSLIVNGAFNLSSGTFYQSGGSLIVNGSFNAGGTFYDLGGTITGKIISGESTLVLGPAAPTLDYTFSGGNVTGTTSAVNIPSNVKITLQSVDPSNDASFYLSTSSGYGPISIVNSYNETRITLLTSGFTNHGIFTLTALGKQFLADAFTNSFINAQDGTLNISSGTVVQSSILNSGTINIGAAGKLTCLSPALNISGGTIAASSDQTTPAVLALTSIYWPAITSATSASITTSQIGATTSGHVDVGGAAAAPFDIENPQATLTISADLINGGINKLGPGNLVLSGYNGYAGTTQVSAGTLTLTQSSTLLTSSIKVSAGASLFLQGSAPNAAIVSSGLVDFPGRAGATPHLIQISSLNLSSGQVATLETPSNFATRTLLSMNTLVLAGSTGAWQSSIDLTGNDMDISLGDLATITDQLRAGSNNGLWNGVGIRSATAATDTSHLMALGVIQNNQSSVAIFSSSNPFDTATPGAGDILVKYTYYGDSNLDGKVDGSDYTRIDSGFLTGSTGWYNGDFNYDGTINGSDYTLIDNAFNLQSVTYTTELATPTAQLAGGASVPEPAFIGISLVAALGLMGRRKR